MQSAPAPDLYEKWHGAGNDFLVVIRTSGAARLDGGWARRWCDRHTGIGADGLIEATRTDGGLAMALYNADGSSAELSGNGIRCLVAAAVTAGVVDEGVVDVVTDAGVRPVTIAMDAGGTAGWGSVEMGRVSFDPAGTLELGVRAEIGNPHVVVCDQGGDEATLLARAATLADRSANVEFVTVLGRDHLSIRVVERGVGITLACGTGSCAAAAVARHLGVTGDSVTVTNPGGDLVVALRGDVATLSGPAVRIASFEPSEVR